MNLCLFFNAFFAARSNSALSSLLNLIFSFLLQKALKNMWSQESEEEERERVVNLLAFSI